MSKNLWTQRARSPERVGSLSLISKQAFAFPEQSMYSKHLTGGGAYGSKRVCVCVCARDPEVPNLSLRMAEENTAGSVAARKGPNVFIQTHICCEAPQLRHIHPPNVGFASENSRRNPGSSETRAPQKPHASLKRDSDHIKDAGDLMLLHLKSSMFFYFP